MNTTPTAPSSPRYAYGAWCHIFDKSGHQTDCRILIDLSAGKLLEAYEWTGAQYEEISGGRAEDLENSIIEVNEAHKTPLTFGLETGDEPPDWSASRAWESLPTSTSADGFLPLEDPFVYFLGIKDGQFQDYTFEVRTRRGADDQPLFVVRPTASEPGSFVGPVHGPLTNAFFENALRRSGVANSHLIAHQAWCINLNSKVPAAIASNFPSYELACHAANQLVESTSPNDLDDEDDPLITIFRIHLDGAQTDEENWTVDDWIDHQGLDAPQWAEAAERPGENS